MKQDSDPDFADVPPPNPIDEHVGGRVRSHRQGLGIDEETLAAALGATVRQLQDWESGRTRIGAARLAKIARRLQVDPAFFFFDAQSDERVFEDNWLTEAPDFRPEQSADAMRLSRALARFKSDALRANVIELVEAMAAISAESRFH